MPVDWRKPAAELGGTAFLLAAVVGSGIMAERLAGGNAAVALLANAVATGGALFALIQTLGPVSGAHLNPAVTLALAMTGRMSRAHVLPYILAQVCGGVLGVWTAHAMFELPVLQVSSQSRAGLGPWIGEVVATFGLIAIVTIDRRRTARDLSGTIAFYIVAAYWFTSSTSFANPAVTLARSLTDSFAGIAPRDVLGFVMAQAVGAFAAFLAVRALGDDSAAADRGLASPAPRQRQSAQTSDV